MLENFKFHVFQLFPIKSQFFLTKVIEKKYCINKCLVDYRKMYLQLTIDKIHHSNLNCLYYMVAL